MIRSHAVRLLQRILRAIQPRAAAQETAALLERLAAAGRKREEDTASLKAARVEAARLSDTCREYEQEIAALTSEKLRLEDRLEAALQDRERVWAELRIALAEERIAYQTQINIDTQRQFGVAPYPNAPKLPADRVPVADSTPTPRRMTPSQAVDAKSREFIEEYRRRYQTQPNPEA